MISVLEQLNSLLSVSSGEGDLEKSASHLAQRHNELAEAPVDKFALAIYDGERMHRKFPVETEEDIKLSHTILERIAPRLPDEVVSTARYHIDLASRELLKKGAYEARPEPVATNVVYAGHIKQRDWHDKVASIGTGDNEIVAGFRVQTPQHVRRVASALPTMALDKITLAEAGVGLMKRAADLGVSLSDQSVTRFARKSVPSNFGEQVRYRQERAPSVLRPYYDELMKEAAAADSPAKLLDVARCVEYLDLYSGFIPAEGETRAMSKLGSETPDAVDMVFPEEEDLMEDQDFAELLQYFGEAFLRQYQEDPDGAMAALSPAERFALQSLLADNV